MEITTQPKEENRIPSFYEAANLNKLLIRSGYNTKDLSSDNFLSLHYLKLNLKRKLNDITEGVELLAKEKKHEPINIGNGFSEYRKVKTDGSTAPAEKEFVDRKTQLEDVKIEGLKLNFMTIEEFRSWAGNIDGQFELTEYLLKEPTAEVKA